jgi:hypothetical protein
MPPLYISTSSAPKTPRSLASSCLERGVCSSLASNCTSSSSNPSGVDLLASKNKAELPAHDEGGIFNVDAVLFLQFHQRIANSRSAGLRIERDYD